MEPAPRRSWVGLVAVALGALTMVSGVLAVFIYARRLPATGVRAALPPPAVPVPVAPPPTPSPGASQAAPTDASPPRPAFTPPAPFTPFPEDTLGPIPVDAAHPLWGTRTALVTLTLFGDLECPHTMATLRELLRLKARAGDDVRLAFRHLTLSQHNAGLVAARALAEIHATRGEQAFWHAIGSIARRGEPLEQGALAVALDDAGLTGFPLPSPVARAETALLTDAELAVTLFVRDSPTLFVNGRRFSGFTPRAVLEEAVERERRTAALALASGVALSRLYTERTRKNLVNLGEDPPSRACVPVGDSPAQGPPAAAVTLVEFTDLECELCRQGEAALATALKTYASDVRVVWKNFPLPQHHRARLAAGVALAARSAAGDTAFWSVTRALFDPRALLDDDSITRALKSAGVDAAGLLAASKSGGYEASLETDIRLADRLGVGGAPTYFVNGHKVTGALPPGELTALLGREVALARRVRAQGAGSVAELACGVTAASAASGKPPTKQAP